MTSRLVRPCLAAVAVSLAAQGYAQPPQPVPAPPATVVPPPPTQGSAIVSGIPVPNPDEPVSLQLPEADIDGLMDLLTMFTGRYVLSPAQLPLPATKFPLKIKNQIPKYEAVSAILTVLALNQVGVVPQGERALIVVPLNQARTAAPEMIEGSTFNQPPSGKIAVKIFQLDFARVNEVQGALQNVLDPRLTGVVPLQNANALMITDSVTNLQRVEKLLEKIDRPNPAGLGTKFYQLKNGAKASDVASKLGTILRTVQLQLGAVTSYTADDRSNQIVLVTDPRQFAIFDDLIDKLDVVSAPNTKNDVVPLKHANAEDVAGILVQIVSKQNAATQRQNPQSVRPGQIATPTPAAPVNPNTPAGAAVPPPAPNIALSALANGTDLPTSSEFSQAMTIVPDKRTNSIVVSGTASDLALLAPLIEKLDVVLPQVRIEVVVAEVTLDDNDASGISALGLKLDGDKLVGFSGSEATIGITNGAITRPGASGGFDLAAEIAIGITPRKNNTTILTVPAIVTSHSKKAVIKDGETRPVLTSTTVIPGATGGTTQSQWQEKQIGTTLTATPYIGGVDGKEAGFVTIDLQQELTDVTGTVVADNNTQYIIGTRSAEQYVSARSGEIIVLGGFRKEIDAKSRNRLGPIPLIGDLFGARKKQKFVQELIFFLRPVILTNNTEIDNAPTMKRIEKLPTREQIKSELDPNYKSPEKSFIDKIIPGR